MEKNKENKKNILFLRRAIDVFVYLFFTFIAYSSYIKLKVLAENHPSVLNQFVFVFDFIFTFFGKGSDKIVFIVALFIVFLFYYFYSRNIKRIRSPFIILFNSIFKFPSTFTIILLGTVGIVFNKFNGNLFVLKIEGLPVFNFFPLLYSFFISTLLFFFMWTINNVRSIKICIEILIAILIAESRKILGLKKKWKPGEKIFHSDISKNENYINETNIISWINATEHQNYDLFGTERLFKTHIGNFIDFDYNFLIYGDYGVGKSWLLSRVKSDIYSKKGNNYIFCSFDGWGRDVNSLDEQILSKVIFEVSSLVDVTHLKYLPTDYFQALSKSDGFLGSLIRIGMTDYNAEKVIQRLDDTLSLINKRIIIAIEDIDRNKNFHDAISNVEPLLDRIKETQNIKYIFALSERNHNLDIDRLFDNKISLDLSRDNLILVYELFRKNLIDYDSFGLIDTYRAKERMDYEFEFDFSYTSPYDSILLNSNNQANKRMKINPKDSYLYLSEIINTPRKIKRFFKEVLDTWIRLSGEVEVDDLVFLLGLKSYDISMFNELINTNLKGLNHSKVLEKYLILENVQENIKNAKSLCARALSAAIIENTKKAMQPFSENRYLEKIKYLKVSGYTDQKLLKLGQDYFIENENVSERKVLEEINKENLYGRLLPLWGKYIYQDEKIGNTNMSVASLKMFEKVELLLLEMAEMIVTKISSDNEHNANQVFAQFLRIVINGLNKNELAKRIKKINQKLFDFYNIKDGFTRANSLYFYISSICHINTLKYIEQYKQSVDGIPDLVKSILENNHFNAVLNFIFDFPTRGRMDSEEGSELILVRLDGNGLMSFRRDHVSWMLDGIFNLAQDGYEKAMIFLLKMISAHLGSTIFYGKIQFSDNVSNHGGIKEKFEELSKILYPHSYVEFVEFIYENLTDRKITEVIENTDFIENKRTEIIEIFQGIKNVIPNIEHDRLANDLINWGNQKGFLIVNESIGIKAEISKELAADVFMHREKPNLTFLIGEAIFYAKERISDASKIKSLEKNILKFLDLTEEKHPVRIVVATNKDSIVKNWGKEFFQVVSKHNYRKYFGNEISLKTEKISDHTWIIHNLEEQITDNK